MHQRDSTRLDASSSALLYLRYGQSIFVYLRGHNISREDAEDLWLEVFWQIWSVLNFQQLTRKYNWPGYDECLTIKCLICIDMRSTIQVSP